jgi:hypothetical protein
MPDGVVAIVRVCALVWDSCGMRVRNARRVGVFVVAVALGLLFGVPSAAATDFVWDPPAPLGSSGTTGSFSTAADWFGGVAPAGSVGELEFGFTGGLVGACSVPSSVGSQAIDDIPGLQTNELGFPEGVDQLDEISPDAGGDPLAIGSGGITVGQNTGADLVVPVDLTAAQTWTDGCELIATDVTGPYPLTVNMTSPGNGIRTSLDLNGELGSVTVDGTTGLSSESLTGDLNGQDGDPVALTDTELDTLGATTGPLTLDGGVVDVGASVVGELAAPGELTVAGPLTLSGAAVELIVAQAGMVGGTDYSQIKASGNVSLNGSQLTLQQGLPSCPALNPGDVLSLITTSGTVSGTFTGLPDGSTLTFGGACLTPSLSATFTASLRINYTPHAVTATVLSASGGVPDSTSAPVVSGNPVVGQTVSASGGSWTGDPTSYTYAWYVCSAGASTQCAPIAGATSQTYTVASTDVGDRLAVVVTATNAYGPGPPVASSVTDVVLPAPATGVVLPPPPVSPTAPTTVIAAATKPANATAPEISGPAIVGRTLSATTGSWTGTAPIAYQHQWFRCSPRCVPITAATGSSYRPSAADVGSNLAVAVVASNPAGSNSAASGQVGPVVAALPSSQQVHAALAIVLSPTHVRASRAALLEPGGYPFSFDAPSAGTLRVTWYMRNTPDKLMLLASATPTFRGAGLATVKLHLTRTGRRTFKRATRLELVVRARFQPTGGTVTAITATRTLTIQH